MLFLIRDTLDVLEGHLEASGYFGQVQIGEFKSAPDERLAASIWLVGASAYQVFLDGGSAEVHTVNIRIYRRAFEEPESEIEHDIAEAASQTMKDISGEFDLGGTIRNVDIGGIAGAPLSVDFGHLDVGGTIFRIADITVPMLVDDSATAAA
tara:strand:+ start:416 stop:871 length:456 start_codon:yes stop_codon:yes gene_type:complete